MQLKALLPLLLFASLESAVPAPELESAVAHNLALAPLLLGERNPCQVLQEQIGQDNPFSQAGIMAVALVPQIDNATSDLSGPRLLWGWKASAVPRATFRLPGTTECPGGELDLFNSSAPVLSDALLEYRYGNSTKSVVLSPSGPNPLPLSLDSGALLPTDFESLYATLLVKLRGKVSAEYSFRSVEYSVACQQAGEYAVCGCEAAAKSGRKKFEREVADERNFSVEVGPNELLWLNPPLSARLVGKQDAKLLLFSRRLPAKMAAGVDGREVASANLLQLDVSDGTCGEKVLGGRFWPDAGGMAVAAGNATVFPAQLVLKNASYLPFYVRFGWEEGAGGKVARIFVEDRFGNSMDFAREFSVRSPSPFFSANSSGALAMRQGSEDRTPAAYPAKGTDGATPDLAPVAALLALVFLLGAAQVARMLSRLARK